MRKGWEEEGRRGGKKEGEREGRKRKEGRKENGRNDEGEGKEGEEEEKNEGGREGKKKRRNHLEMELATCSGEAHPSKERPGHFLKLGRGENQENIKELPPQGELVTPRWISGRRSRRAIEGAEKAASPDHGEVAVTVEGKQLVLVLERNQFLSPDYAEIHYAEDGQPVTVSPNHTEWCYFHGYVRGHVDSWVVLTSCSGFR
ncbi:disintegrin and metalloproteinase domain-containing protein 33 [Crotalus adamanteus]|uniref:Disintegrin and metalloproteinase domain-containing protein 33 n=1 Tax=Crotalus adamanteus TaxID=8729 RepID=A0AAW1B8U8_CROAD